MKSRRFLRSEIVFGMLFLISCQIAIGSLVENFDSGNPYATPEILGTPPGPEIIDGGPSGRFLRLVHDGTSTNMNTYTFGITDAGLYPVIYSTFEFRIASASMPADGFAFMLIPTDHYGDHGTGPYAAGSAEKPNIPFVFGVGFDVYPPGTNQVTLHWDNEEVKSVDVEPGQINISDGSFCHFEMKLEFVGGGAFVSLSLWPDIYGSGGSEVVVYNQQYLEGLAPFEYRVEFAARTGGLTADVDIDNIKVVPQEGPLPANCTPVMSDLNKDCWVNLLDLAIMARDWLSCSIEPPGDCYE